MALLTGSANTTDAGEVSSRATDVEQMKGEFLASLNHEFRTPLSGILGMTDLLLEMSLDAEQREYVETIRECGLQLLDTVDTVLDYSALSTATETIHHEEFPLRETFETMIGAMQLRLSNKDVEFEASLPGDLPETAVGDERHLRQVLNQLIGNAIKFTSRGSVRLSVEMESVTPAGFCLKIEVRDTGIGIPEDKLKAIFESFRQVDTGLARNYTGLGLGLALVERVVHLAGGQITVESEAGKGSTFTVRLPLETGASARPHLVYRNPAPAVGKQKILIVDDNEIARTVVEHILSRPEYELAFAQSGEDAIEMCHRGPYDLILMDLQMPGVDGLEATRRIRRLAGFEATPVVALTANYSDVDRRRCLEAGMQDFLPKPINREQLTGTVHGILSTRRL